MHVGRPPPEDSTGDDLSAVPGPQPDRWTTRLDREIQQVEHSGTDWPRWLLIGRQLVVFFLGVAVILYSVVTTGHDLPFLVVGLILIGMVPIEQVIERLTRRRQLEQAEAAAPPTKPHLS